MRGTGEFRARNAKGRTEEIMLPQDSVMLLSFVNMKLRDLYQDLDALCEDLQADRAEIIQKLETIDYHYDREKNQFV